ncbi:MAG: ThuA domain-containing protein [Pirellulaceae bacterium]
MTPTRVFTIYARFVEVCTLGLTACLFVVQPIGAAEGQETPKLRVLIVSGLNNHDWRSTTPTIEKMFRGCSRFGAVDVTDAPADLDARRLAEYDVVVSNWTPYPDNGRTWRPELESAFLAFVRRGGGFVVIHAAACTFQVWPEFQDLIALTWKENYTAHSAYHTFKVSVESPEHPIASGLTDFLTTDELYHNMVSLTDHPRQVVFKAFSASEQSGTGKYEPVVVCTEVGQGRGVNLVLGHDAAAMGAGFQTLLLRSAEWAATSKVTIPPPAIWPNTATALEAANVAIDATFESVTRFAEGDERKPLHAVQQLIRYANSEDSDAARRLRETLAARMVALLASPDATPAAKAFVCGQFPAVATDEQAPALTALLADKDLADPALRGLTMIPGVAVDQILREALEKASGISKVGVVNALGQRGDRAAVEAIGKLLRSDDELLACAAAGALGKIGGDEAAAALLQALADTHGRLRESVADACLARADRLLANGLRESAAALYERLIGAGETEQVRMAAWRGTVLARPDQAVEMICEALISGDGERESMALGWLPGAPGGAAATAQMAMCLARVNPSMQVPLIAALAVRRDPAAREAIEAAAQSGDATVRLAALKALGIVGGESSVKLLVEHTLAAVGTPEGDEARGSLVRLPDVHVSEALAGMLAQRSAAEKVELIRILAARKACMVVEQLEQMTADADASVRLESWKALESVAQVADVKRLLELLVGVPETEREAAETAVVAVLKKAARPDASVILEQVEAVEVPAVHVSLLRILTAVGDDRGLPAMHEGIRSPDATVRDVAIRTLAAWPTPAPLEDLVTLARSAPESIHRVLALRGAIRLSRLVPDRSPEQMTKLVGELLALARETAERKAVLAELGQCPTRDALQLALQCLAQPELATEAGWAVTQIASAIRDTQRAEAVSALQRIMAVPGDASVRALAGKVLKDILQPVNLALGAAASSPDGLDPDGASGGEQAAIDGNPSTYWDEVDNAELYRLKVTFPEPTDVSSINILWHPYEQHQAKVLDVLCDGAKVAEVRETPCVEHEMFVAFPTVRCRTVELSMPGKNGLVSPAIHEFQIFGDWLLDTPGSNAPQTTEKGS